MMSHIESGTVSYLISLKWIKRYFKWILHDQFKNEIPESELRVRDDHFEKNHPGPISNE